ncbi:dihydroneopterin aldolase [Pseudoroseicyclus tamaricis]|uniref:Diguanylate cyclase n=1 Tax=Pseudoroseicyclus tamaricis TaxID=2705421 RepID=A0A6B2JTB1_9RHOB|nr:dihydroneopterin aldolase [Pseudoroseicyclus tamaricis]NDU99808.1 diguanylate cyclase [Pseudoroseicyclus tamaricis]
MSDDIAEAFGHPEGRTRALEGLADRISVRDYRLEAEIGAFQAERGLRQGLQFDAVVEVAAQAAGDDVDAILSYDRITEAIGAELSAARHDLLESLAEAIAARILAEPLAARVILRIQKLDRGPYALGVEIVREKGEAAGEAEIPAHRVVLLPGPLARAPGLGEVLAGLTDLPLILVVGPADLPLPAAEEAEAARRIGLLAMEQAAWALHGRLPELVPVSSRTELDWGLRNGQTGIWLPSRLVLNSPSAPEEIDAATLAAWLADHMGAAELVSLGAPVPVTLVPAREVPL